MNIAKEDPRFWDVRTIDRRIRRGLVGRKDYEKHLKSLPDVADKAAPIDLTDEPPEPPEPEEEPAVESEPPIEV
jgi:hypothetical protein